MYARLVAFVCLINACLFAASSEPVNQGSNEVAVYIRPQDGVPATAIDAMRQETSSLMQTGGYQIQWLDRPREVTAAYLVMVELGHSCKTDSTSRTQVARRGLASAVVENGRILPFIKVNCAAVRQFLIAALGPGGNPEFLYGRALGRLLAHELYHVVGQTADHTRGGVTQAAVSVGELISERFMFCEAAVQTLRRHLESIDPDFASYPEADAR